MHQPQPINFFSKENNFAKIFAAFFIFFISFNLYAAAIPPDSKNTVDQVQVVTQQIDLLKNRLAQAQEELTNVQAQHDKQNSVLGLDKINKNSIDKTNLNISIAKSNLDSITIELADSEQTAVWLEKNEQEIENQLNVLGVLGLKNSHPNVLAAAGLNADLDYQKKLLQLEKQRSILLRNLQNIANNIYQMQKDQLSRLNAAAKSRHMLNIKQQQAKEELAFQEQQNYWLKQLNLLYSKLDKMNVENNQDEYAAVERDVFYANENANFSYIQSVIARYKDNIQQIRLMVLKISSISTLNEINDQVQFLIKQVYKINDLLKDRIDTIEKQKLLLEKKSTNPEQIKFYLSRLNYLESEYQATEPVLTDINQKLTGFRAGLDQALQNELSSRQGFLAFNIKTFLDLGKEVMLLPALSFQIIKNLSNVMTSAAQTINVGSGSILLLIETAVIFVFLFIRKLLTRFSRSKIPNPDKIPFAWLYLEWLRRNFTGFIVLANFVGILLYLGLSLQSFSVLIYLALAGLICRGTIILARLFLVETTHDTSGHDVKLYYRLKWTFLLGSVVIVLTVFVNQLPMIYELKMLCDRLFLIFLLVVSLFLLKSWHVVPNLILAHMETQHTYLKKSVQMLGILVPLILLFNAIIGLIGYINLIFTVSWYEGIFLIVLTFYLILRGLLREGTEQISKLLIQYVNNGWLWTEAFLKPIDNVLRITLFLVAWTVLFLFYGWDKESPIVERLTALLHYQLASISSTSITPINMLELVVVISIFYWTARWIREFVFRLLISRTQDMGIRNSIAILSQYFVIFLGIFICLKVLGIDYTLLKWSLSMFFFAIGLGMRDLANNFVCGFLILVERPLRVGDIVTINDQEGEVTHFGSRAVTIKTYDRLEYLVPNTEIFNKSFINWTAKDNIVRSIVRIVIHSDADPHAIKVLIQDVLLSNNEVLKEPIPGVYLKILGENLEFELRYFVNIRQVKSQLSVQSNVLLQIWNKLAEHNIKPPHPYIVVDLQNEKTIMPEKASTVLGIENMSPESEKA